MIDREPNYYRFLGILLILGILIYYSPIPKYLFPDKPIVNNTKILTVEKIVTILVTPTPDNINYFSNEYQSGLRMLKKPFTWIKNNALGKQDMRVTVKVYDFLIFEKIHWFNPSTYNYYEQLPEKENDKFLFIFINVEMDNTVSDDTRLWLPDKNKYAVQVNGIIYYAKNYPEQLRIKELELFTNLNGDSYIQHYGQTRLYSTSSEYTSSAGEFSDKHYYLRAGKSNSEDGYLLFEIPKSANPEDIIVLGNFFNFGSAQWRLK